MNDPFIPFRLTVCGIEELTGHCATGASHVLSILDPGTPQPDAFGSFGEHERLELRFHDIIDEAQGLLAPQQEHVRQVLAFGADLLHEPPAEAHLLVHCHAGVSRSTASMIMILAQARPDRSAAEVVSHVVSIRPQAWPNIRMIELGDALLGRHGALVAAVRAHHGQALKRFPHVGEYMMNAGRTREVTEALEAARATAG